MPSGAIIFLHGASSSGKSTLARSLQARISPAFWHVSIDHLRDGGVVPMARYRSGEFDWRADRAAFFDGFHRSLVAYAGAGNNLILEHILESPDWLAGLAAMLAPFDVFFVGVHCPLDELIRREAARGDRPAGMAEQDFARIHRGLEYDFEVDTSVAAPQDIVEHILQGWHQRREPSVFSRLAGSGERPQSR